MEKFETFGQIVQYLEKQPDNPTAFNIKNEGYWLPTSTKEFLYDLKRLTYGLIAMGINRGDKIGILSKPMPNWILADLAIILAGGISVPLFAKISDENFIYEVAQANVRFLFVGGSEQWKKFIRHESFFESVIGLNKYEYDHDILSFHEILKKGEALWHEKPKLFDQLLLELRGDDVATIVYTSGSTGAPKGAELTQKNLIHLITQDVFAWRPDEKYLSILPLPHIFARQIVYIMLTWGVSIYFLGDLLEFAPVCRELEPNLMIVVPRLLEKVHEGFVNQIKKQPKWLKFLGNQALLHAAKPKKNLLQKYILTPFFDLFVYRKFRKALGTKWRIILCGGAKLNTELYQTFLTMGFPIYEGWGLTEASTCCVNRPGQIEVGTVGPPLPGIQVKIGNDDEVLVAGPTVMKGYYRYPKATQNAFDSEGWLHTGDKGKIDEKGFLTIIGRIKEQFKLSTGEYVVPCRIEQILAYNCPLIEMALVVGEAKPFASVLLFPNMKEVGKLKSEQGKQQMSDLDFLQTDIVKKQIQQVIDETNKKINKYEKMMKFRFILEPLSVEAGELTPTLKIKRDVVQQKYQEIIDAMYIPSGSEEASTKERS
jgi:long-chain acyl-CoA synthetase